MPNSAFGTLLFIALHRVPSYLSMTPESPQAYTSEDEVPQTPLRVAVVPLTCEPQPSTETAAETFMGAGTNMDRMTKANVVTAIPHLNKRVISTSLAAESKPDDQQEASGPEPTVRGGLEVDLALNKPW